MFQRQKDRGQNIVLFYVLPVVQQESRGVSGLWFFTRRNRDNPTDVRLIWEIRGEVSQERHAQLGLSKQQPQTLKQLCSRYHLLMLGLRRKSGSPWAQLSLHLRAVRVSVSTAQPTPRGCEDVPEHGSAYTTGLWVFPWAQLSLYHGAVSVSVSTAQPVLFETVCSHFGLATFLRFLPFQASWLWLRVMRRHLIIPTLHHRLAADSQNPSLFCVVV